MNGANGSVTSEKSTTESPHGPTDDGNGAAGKNTTK